MRLTSIQIENMAAFQSFAAQLPAVTILQGRNGEGKSSFLDCLKFAFGRGHNEDMIHGDAPFGEILIEFDNGAALKCRASRERQETVRSWRAPGSKRFVVSREQIDSISNAVSYDPLAFLDKSESEQLELLLRIVAIECSEEEMQAAIGDLAVDPPVTGGNALEKIEAIRKQFYNRRRDANVSADTQEKHASELEKSLPPAAPEGTDWTQEVSRLEGEKAAIEQRLTERIAEIKDLLEGEKLAANTAYQQAVETAAAARDARIEAARTQANEAVAKVRAEDSARLTDTVTQLATAQERTRAIAQANGTRLAMESARQGVATAKETSARLTEAMERLDALKRTVASRLPISGITIQDGRILREEQGKLVPFSRWNTEARMRFCLRIAVLAHGEAGFICIDNAEHFDVGKRQALFNTAEKYAAKDGLQFLIATVADQPLTVSGVGA